MPVSDDQARRMACDYFASAFGVSRTWLESLHFSAVRDEEIWITDQPVPERLIGARAPGLRALRIQPHALKPTSVFLACLGDRIQDGRIDVDRDTLQQLARGQAIPHEGENRFVALSFAGDIIGCGEVRRGQLRAMIPTGRRRELLEALAGLASADLTNL